MSRLTAAALAVLIALSLLLSACQSAVPPAPEGTPVSGVTAVPTPHRPTLTPVPKTTVVPAELRIRPETLKGVQIHFWHGWSGETARQVQDLADAFNRDNVWGIRVVVDAVGGNAVLFDHVNASLAAGDPPALVAAPLDYLSNWNDRGSVVDLETYVTSADWGLSAPEVEDFHQSFWEETAVGARRLGIPADRTAQVLYYNLTWARELGFSKPPATTAEFQQQACAAAQALVQDKDKTNDGMGGWVIDRDAPTLLSWMAAFGAREPSASAQDYSFNTPQSAAAFAYLRKLFDNSCAWLSRNPLPYDYFASRQSLFYAGDLSEIALQEKVNSRLGVKDQWTVLPFPSQSGKPVLVSGGSSYAMLKRKPVDQLAAWLLIRWLILPRNQARLVKSGLSLPVADSVLAELAAFNQPQWKAAVQEMDLLSPAPGLPDWWLARNILEDAGWQMLQPTAQPPSAVLKQLDDTLADILQHQSQQP